MTILKFIFNGPLVQFLFLHQNFVSFIIVSMNTINYKERINYILAGFPDYVFSYFMYCDGTLDRSPKTMIGYAYDIKTFFDFMIERNPLVTAYSDITYSVLNKLKPQDIQEYMSYLRSYEDDGKIVNNAASSRARKLSCLRSFFQYLFMYGDLKTNPAKLIETPRIRKKKQSRLDIDEVNQLIENVASGSGLTDEQLIYYKRTQYRDTAIIVLILYSGIRVSEVSNLDLGDIDRKNKTIKVIRKGGNEDTVYVSDTVINVIDAYIEFERKPFDDGNQALFLSSRNQMDTRLTTRSIERLVRKYGQTVNATKKTTPHSLRRTFGTKLYNETGDIFLTATALGHKDAKVTMDAYTEIQESRKDLIRKVNYDSE